MTCAKSSGWRKRPSPQGKHELDDPRGVVFEAKPAVAGHAGGVPLPGQGAQSPGMLRELAVVFPEVRAGVRGVRPRARAPRAAGPSARSFFRRRRSATTGATRLAGS